MFSGRYARLSTRCSSQLACGIISQNIRNTGNFLSLVGYNTRNLFGCIPIDSGNASCIACRRSQHDVGGDPAGCLLALRVPLANALQRCADPVRPAQAAPVRGWRGTSQPLYRVSGGHDKELGREVTSSSQHGQSASSASKQSRSTLRSSTRSSSIAENRFRVLSASRGDW